MAYAASQPPPSVAVSPARHRKTAAKLGAAEQFRGVDHAASVEGLPSFVSEIALVRRVVSRLPLSHLVNLYLRNNR